MKKKLSAILVIVLAFCMSIPVFAAPSNYPTEGSPANQPSEFKIEKKYVKLDENALAEQYPDETLKFVSTCKAAPVDISAAPNLSVADLKVSAITNDIAVTVPTYTVPGKYNYEIKEQSPSAHTPDSKDSAGVVYDKKAVYIQVVVKYDGGDLKKFVTVTSEDAGIGAGNDNTQDNGNKKGDFKNKYLLDGEIDPESPDPKPEPNPNPIPTPDPDKPEPDPVTPIPGPDGQDPDAAELAKFKIMKQVRGPLASHDQNFDVTVTLTSEKPVRSDISYTGGSIKKVGEGSGWTGDDTRGYTATVNLSMKDDQTVVFSGVPAGVAYTVKEDDKHIGELTADNLNDPSKGYTVAYYGGGKALDNPTPSDPKADHGKSLSATGTVGKDTNNNIIIANSKGMNDEDSDMVKPNTGIHLDSLPYIMILALVVLGAGMMIVKSRRRREE